MPYIINFHKNHPFPYMAGKSLEFFRIRYDGKERRYVRDEETGLGWGFVHPKENRIVRVVTAGEGNTPNLGKLNPAYEIVEVFLPPFEPSNMDVSETIFSILDEEE